MCGSDEGGGSPSIDATPQQEEAVSEASQMWDWYQTNYKPLIEKWASHTTSPEVKTEETKATAGKVNAEVMKAVGGVKTTTNPVANTKALLPMAAAGSKAQVAGAAGVKARQIGETQNVIDIGRGEAAQALTTADKLAGMSVKEAMFETELEQEVQAGKENAVGSLMGTAGAIGLAGIKNKMGGAKSLAPQNIFSEATVLPGGVVPNAPV